MTCREFERAWNELIDAEAGGRAAGTADVCTAQTNPAMAERERVLLEHAAGCRSCGVVSARYRTLRQAIRVLGSPPAPPAGFADQVIAQVQSAAPSAWPLYEPVRRESFRPIFVAIAATLAAVAITIPFLLNRVQNSLRRNDPSAVLRVTGVNAGLRDRQSQSVVDARALNDALAEATAATWDLARSASEPAARISRQVLDAATLPEQNTSSALLGAGTEPVVSMVSVPSLDVLAPDAAAAGALLQQVGGRLATGVRPLSNTARHAFGFLLGPTLAKPDVPINPPAQKGA